MKVISEDDWILVVDKPSGLAAHAAQGVSGDDLLTLARAHALLSDSRWHSATASATSRSRSRRASLQDRSWFRSMWPAAT